MNKSNKKILVIGDVMLDKYWFSLPKSLSPEAPILDVEVEQCEYRAGGAANVALNIQQLRDDGIDVGLLAPLGQDDDGDILSGLIKQAGITCYWLYDGNKTITKHRIVSNKHQLLRVDFEEPYNAIELNQDLKHIIDRFDVIVFFRL